MVEITPGDCGNIMNVSSVSSGDINSSVNPLSSRWSCDCCPSNGCPSNGRPSLNTLSVQWYNRTGDSRGIASAVVVSCVRLVVWAVV